MSSGENIAATLSESPTGEVLSPDGPPILSGIPTPSPNLTASPDEERPDLVQRSLSVGDKGQNEVLIAEAGDYLSLSTLEPREIGRSKVLDVSCPPDDFTTIPKALEDPIDQRSTPRQSPTSEQTLLDAFGTLRIQPPPADDPGKGGKDEVKDESTNAGEAKFRHDFFAQFGFHQPSPVNKDNSGNGESVRNVEEENFQKEFYARFGFYQINPYDNKWQGPPPPLSDKNESGVVRSVPR